MLQIKMICLSKMKERLRNYLEQFRYAPVSGIRQLAGESPTRSAYRRDNVEVVIHGLILAPILLLTCFLVLAIFSPIWVPIHLLTNFIYEDSRTSRSEEES